jgi:hypothetical protein
MLVIYVILQYIHFRKVALQLTYMKNKFNIIAFMLNIKTSLKVI